MGWCQKELEEMRSVTKQRFLQSWPSSCVYCGSLIYTFEYMLEKPYQIHCFHLVYRKGVFYLAVGCMACDKYPSVSARGAISLGLGPVVAVPSVSGAPSGRHTSGLYGPPSRSS